MNNKLLVLIAIAGSLSLLGKVPVMENPLAPAGIEGRNPGRSVPLKEVMRITDEGQNIIFKRINRIRVADDDSVFISAPAQLYRFDPFGKLLHTFIVQGEGPGEVKFFTNFALDGENVIVGAFRPVKFIKFSSDGSLEKEHTIRSVLPFTIMLGQWNGRVFFVSSDRHLDTAKSGVNERENEIIYVGDDGTPARTGLKFLTLDVMKQLKTEHGPLMLMDELTSLLTAFDRKGFLYVSHNERYGITQIDLSTGRIVRTFRRSFQPVDYEKKRNLDKMAAELQALHTIKYYNDIYQILTNGRELMVFTSVMNSKKEVLVDVFDDSGRYIDQFFIRIPGVERPDDLRSKPLCFQNGFFWTTGTNEEDAPFVLKYRMEE